MEELKLRDLQLEESGVFEAGDSANPAKNVNKKKSKVLNKDSKFYQLTDLDADCAPAPPTESSTRAQRGSRRASPGDKPGPRKDVFDFDFGAPRAQLKKNKSSVLLEKHSKCTLFGGKGAPREDSSKTSNDDAQQFGTHKQKAPTPKNFSMIGFARRSQVATASKDPFGDFFSKVDFKGAEPPRHARNKSTLVKGSAELLELDFEGGAPGKTGQSGNKYDFMDGLLEGPSQPPRRPNRAAKGGLEPQFV